MDWFSFGLGALVASVILVIIMILLLIWFSYKAYQMGWRDCEKGESIIQGVSV